MEVVVKEIIVPEGGEKWQIKWETHFTSYR
jgi:hypothetical protein